MQGWRPGRLTLTPLGIACLTLVWSQTALAQVKLEHKYTEGEKLTYKTSSKTHQTLTLMGMEIETTDDRSVVSSLSTGKRRSDSTLPLERKVESLRVELSSSRWHQGELRHGRTQRQGRRPEPCVSWLIFLNWPARSPIPSCLMTRTR